MTSRIHLAAADYVVIFGYCLLVLWIGLWFRKQRSTVADYFDVATKSRGGSLESRITCRSLAPSPSLRISMASPQSLCYG